MKNNMLFGFVGKQARMREFLNEEGMALQGELHGGILWPKNDMYARVIGSESSGCVRGVGFGPTPLGRSGANFSRFILTPPSSSEITQRISELETSFVDVREQLAQSEARHEEQLTQSLAQSKVRHQEQLTQSLAQ